MSDGYKNVTVLRGRYDGKLHVCELPIGRDVSSGDVVLFGDYDAPDEGLCVCNSVLVDEETVRMLEAAAGVKRPLIQVRGKMVAEYFDESR